METTLVKHFNPATKKFDVIKVRVLERFKNSGTIRVLIDGKSKMKAHENVLEARTL